MSSASVTAAIAATLWAGWSFATGAPPKAAIAFAQAPLAFEKNAGQTDARFSFLAHGAGHAIYLAPCEAIVALDKSELQKSSRLVSSLLDRTLASPSASDSQRLLRFTLVNGRTNAPGRGLTALSGKVHHLTGSSRSWATNVSAFTRVQFDQVYPGIDLIYHGNQANFEYDFVVAPDADPAVIAFEVEGADRVNIDERGDLVLQAGSGSFHHHKPLVYQTILGQRREVAGRFALSGSNRVTFVLGDYDRRCALVIDPVLSLEYSTYLGSGKTDRAWAVAADASGNVYVAGDTLGTLKTVPAIGFQTNSGGGTRYGGDAFVAKLDATGTNFIYFTYLGGNSLEGANGLAVDAAGAAYVAGFTTSTNFPIYPAIGALQPAIRGTNIAQFKIHPADAFVTKLDANGLPVYSTYLGGESADVAASIAVDTNGCAYLTGYTESAVTYRVTNEIQSVICTNTTATNVICLAPIFRTNQTIVRTLVSNSVVTNLVWISPTIPADTNEFRPFATDTLTTTLLGAEQLTGGFPTLNPLQANNAGGPDIFVTKLSADGSSLMYSTYLGGALSADVGTGIAVDPSGRAVISGFATEGDFPVTNGVQEFFGGGRDAVAARLEPDGSALVYATYLGGTLTDIAYGVAVDSAGSAYVVGSEASHDFLTTPGLVRRGGVSKSIDGGTNWLSASAGLTHTGVRALAINPAAPTTLYAATPRGIFLSTDAANSWSPSSDDVAGVDMSAITIDPGAPSTLYAAGPAGFYRSDDAGFSWTLLGSGLPMTSTESIVRDPLDSQLLYAGTRFGFYVSTNGGTNFVRTGRGLRNRSIHRLVIDPVNSSLFYAATDGGVYESTNAGLNWRSLNTGLATRRVLALAINPSTPTTLIAGTVKGVYRTVDAGTNWLGATNGIGRPQVNNVMYDPSDSSIVYAASTNGFFKSADGGVNWTNLSDGLTSRDLVALAIDPSNPALIYTGARGTNFSGGTNDAFLVKLTPDGTGVAYGFTFGGTRSDEARAVAVDTNGSAFVTGLTLSRNFPVVSATNRWQATNSGKSDAFIAQFDPTGTSNIFAILLGGHRTDSGHAIALDGQGGIYVAGITDSRDFVVTNAVQWKRAGEKQDAFVTKIQLPDAGPAEPPQPIIFPPFNPRMFPIRNRPLNP